MQNIYDNDVFFNSYSDLRKNNQGLNDVLEIPAFRSIIPDLNGKKILDLGCGYGDSSKWYISQGAKKVTAVDISEKMINMAREINSDENIEYIRLPMEEIDFPKNSFDIVLSSLAFHYIRDFDGLVSKISKILKPKGILIFSQEHPIALAKKAVNGWVKNEKGEKLHWIIDNYHEEGIREHKWFIDGVIKYHRSISTIFNNLIDNGFNIMKVLEPIATSEAEEKDEKLKEERRRPPFIIIKAHRL